MPQLDPDRKPAVRFPSSKRRKGISPKKYKGDRNVAGDEGPWYGDRMWHSTWRYSAKKRA